MSNKKFLSIVIPTYNRAVLLGQTLESLSRQTYPANRYEIIVVDNNSTDKTQEICRSFKNSYPGIFNYYFLKKHGLHYGRNLGIRKSNGEIIIYIDDDVQVTQKWLVDIAKSFEKDKRIMLVGGNCLPDYQIPPPNWTNELWSKSKHGNYSVYYSLIDFGDIKTVIEPEYVLGCNFAVRKKLLEKVKGFHPDNMPNNMIFLRGDGETYVAREIKKRGYLAFFNSSATIYHKITSEKLTKRYVYKIAFRLGVSAAYTNIRESKRHFPNKFFAESIKKIYNKFINAEYFSALREISYFSGYLFLFTCSLIPKVYRWINKENYLS